MTNQKQCRYIVVEIPTDPDAYHIEKPVLETDDADRARQLRDEMRVAYNNASFEAYDRQANRYMDSDAIPNCVCIRPNYTSFWLTPDVISDGLGHDFQVMEGRLYHSPWKYNIYITIILDQFGVQYPDSRHELMSKRGPDDPGSSDWHDEEGATIHNESLTRHLNVFRRQILKQM